MRRLIQLVQHPHYGPGSEMVRAKDVRERLWCWLAIGARGLRILDETQMTVKLSAEWGQLESCVAHGGCLGLKDRSGREVTAAKARSAPSAPVYIYLQFTVVLYTLRATSQPILLLHVIECMIATQCLCVVIPVRRWLSC